MTPERAACQPPPSDAAHTTRAGSARSIVAVLLVLVYAAPLFFPPVPVPPGTLVPPDAWLLQRIFPGVPASWVAVRLIALAAAAMLLSAASPFAAEPFLRSAHATYGAPPGRRRLALVVAMTQAICAPWAARLGTVGQCVYVAGLFAPAVLLARPREATAGTRSLRCVVPAAAVILVWVALRLASDLGAPRVAHPVDGWLGVLAIARFVEQPGNILTDVLDPRLMGVGSFMLVFQGVPLFRLGILPMTLRTVQVFQIVWIAVSAGAIGLIARRVVGRGVAAVAVAVFLFSPYVRFVTLFPGPFLVGPLYSTALALAALSVRQRRSEAALALFGALCGIAVTYPGLLPVVGLLVVFVVCDLRKWRTGLWIGVGAGLASFAAVVVPALPKVFTPDMLAHFRHNGMIETIDPALLGQLPIRSAKPDTSVPRIADIVAAALISPFAHPRMGVRLWGDAIFDPLGAVFIAVGLVVCLRSALRSWRARALVLFFGAALSPAFVSPVDVVNAVHAVVLPVAAALVAAAGFGAVRRRLGWGPKATAAAVVAIAVGGSVLFDVVNPRILRPASLGIMLDVLRPAAEDRVVVLDYPDGTIGDMKRWLYAGAIATFAAERPLGYLAFPGRRFPVVDLAAEGKDLLFWSFAMETDLAVSDAVCASWPTATLYEIRDEAGLGSVYAARTGEAPWTPAAAETRWRASSCSSRGG